MSADQNRGGSASARAGRAAGGPADERPGIVGEILFVELLGGFGDLLIALPAIHRLADSHPEAALRVVTFAPGGQLLAGDPRVGEVIELADHTAPAIHAALAAAVARRRPDLVVTTSRHSGIPALLARAMERSGDTSGGSARVPALVADLWRQPPATEPVGTRYLRLLAADGWVDSTPRQPGRTAPGAVALDEGERAEGARWLRRFTGGRACPVLLVPEAGMAVKRWPARRWSALARELDRRGHPVLSASTHVRFERGTPVQVLPPAPLRLFAAVGAATGRAGGVVVGGDTGPVRLAVAVGAPAVGLFGPTSASRYGFAPSVPAQDTPRPRTGTSGTSAAGWERHAPVAVVDLQGLPGCPVRRPLAITEQECWWTADCPLSETDPACMVDLGVTAVAVAVARTVAAGQVYSESSSVVRRFVR
ncbi:glycosyltransferase family 9 protein [Pseudofrankia asymbiotica]|uniref:Glycosyl transferase n=1 Tax=Pseudofrankia asymbiotica TaxID=1834516 RepID=A0A1V2I3Q5_9ACTN|nr:glycosyltransferase family 9 protein [Pseudofrankia asymbiotica]ONH23658.1 hypothetical protein BL253_32340 [Pseudofrankia asymbiotica]